MLTTNHLPSGTSIAASSDHPLATSTVIWLASLKNYNTLIFDLSETLFIADVSGLEPEEFFLL